MPTLRRRPRIAIGFAPGGRSNLIASLTPSAEEQAAAKAQRRAQDQAQFNSFKRGDIPLAALEAYVAKRSAEEDTDAAYATTLKDSLESARVEDTRRMDSKKVAAWRDGGLQWADLEKYFQGRLASSLNARDREDTQTALAALRVEYHQKQDQSALSKWKAGQMTNATFKAYLQGRLAGATGDEDRANLSAAIKGVDDKARVDMDAKMEADYRSGKLGAGAEGIRAYSQYLVGQASRTDITPEEAAAYDAKRQITEDNYNAQVDNRVYYEYLGGQRSYGSAVDYMQKRLGQARPEQADRLQQFLVQMKDREQQKMKAAASAGAAGQAKLDSFVKDKVNFAKKQLEEALQNAALIRDPEQRAQFIAAAYQEYGKVLTAASRPLPGGGQSSDADEYLTMVRNVPNDAKLSIMDLVGKYETDRVIKSNDTDRQLAGSASEKASTIAGNIARLIELRDNPYLSPAELDRLDEQIRKERKLADNQLAEARKARDDAEFSLSQKEEEYKLAPTNSLAAAINKLKRDFDDARNAEGALSRALVANDAELYGYREHDARVETERQEAAARGLTDATVRQGERNRSTAPAAAPATTPSGSAATLFEAPAGGLGSSFRFEAPKPLVVGTDVSGIQNQRREEQGASAPLPTPEQPAFDPYTLTPDSGLFDFQMPSLTDYLGNPSSPDAAADLTQQSEDIFGRFNRAIIGLQ